MKPFLSALESDFGARVNLKIAAFNLLQSGVLFGWQTT